MKAYQLDNEGFFIEETDCVESPLEPGVYLIPGGCITEPPLPRFGKNEIPQYVNGEWKIVPNFSGVLYFSKKDFSNEKLFFKGEDKPKDFDSLYTTVTPLSNESFQKWNEEKGIWEIDLEKKIRPETYYLKSNFREVKLFSFAEEPDLINYTTIPPIKNEEFQKFDELSSSWVFDEEGKKKSEIYIKIAEYHVKLKESDFRMSIDYFETMNTADQEKWKRDRAEWRTAIRELQKTL